MRTVPGKTLELGSDRGGRARAVTVNDPSFGEVVRRELNVNPIPYQDLDMVLAETA